MSTSFNRQDMELAVEALKPFTTKNIRFANWQFISTFLMLWGSVFTSFFFFDKTPWVLIFSVPITLVFMCRSYVIEHDCGHHSFFQKPIWNHIIGNVVGVGITIPFSMWKFIHNSHHAHVGNLDKRDVNPEVLTMTVKEYVNSGFFKRIGYRLLRSRLMRLTLLPILNFGIAGRVIHPKYSRTAKMSVIFYNLLYLSIFWTFIYYFGFFNLFFIFLLPLFGFYSIAAFTFYGQHQYEDTYWQTEEYWSWEEATISGASNITAPLWFRWLVGNVVCHTVHHICVNIPNYSLHDAQQRLNTILNVKSYSVKDIWSFLGLKLWDENSQKLVSFKQGLTR